MEISILFSFFIVNTVQKAAFAFTDDAGQLKKITVNEDFEAFEQLDPNTLKIISYLPANRTDDKKYHCYFSAAKEFGFCCITPDFR